MSAPPTATGPAGGVVYYDAACPFCTRWARRGERWLAARGVRFAPLSAPSDELKLVTADGLTRGGADALMFLARRLWWTWPLWALSRVPGMLAVMRRVYRAIARRRSCPAVTPRAE